MNQAGMFPMGNRSQRVSFGVPASEASASSAFCSTQAEAGSERDAEEGEEQAGDEQQEQLAADLQRYGDELAETDMSWADIPGPKPRVTRKKRRRTRNVFTSKLNSDTGKKLKVPAEAKAAGALGEGSADPSEAGASGSDPEPEPEVAKHDALRHVAISLLLEELIFPKQHLAVGVR